MNIFTLRTDTVTHTELQFNTFRAELFLVDLAGSERVAKAGTTGVQVCCSQLYYTVYIYALYDHIYTFIHLLYTHLYTSCTPIHTPNAPVIHPKCTYITYVCS